MHVLFVHGMGRSPISGWPLLWQLKQAGLKTSTFGYWVNASSFEQIVTRLVSTISALSAQDDVVLLGHSLGGVLLRAAINALPEGSKPPHALFLLGSPQQSSLLATRLSRSSIFQFLTHDCGQVLASDERMARVPPVSIPTIAFIGVSGPRGRHTPFGDELNDGVVSVTEVSAAWMQDQLEVSILHTLMPSSRQIARIVVQKLALMTA